jgi:hypothetical protein
MRWQCVLRPCSLDRAGVAQRWLGHWFRIGLVRSDILSEFLAQLNYISKLSYVSFSTRTDMFASEIGSVLA